MPYHSPFTDEEIEADRQDILEMLKQGIPGRIIMEELGRTKSYVETTKKYLIKTNKITIEELEQARKEYRKQNPTAQGINKTKVYKKNSHQKSIQKNLDKEKNKEQVLELFKKGHTQSEIANKLQMSDSSINFYKKELIDEGKLKKEEIKIATYAEYHSRMDEFYEYVPKVIKLLMDGESPFEIREKLDLSSYAYTIIREYIIKNQLILKEEIDRAREKREKKRLKIVEKAIKSGDSLNKIVKEYPDISTRKIKELSKSLIDKGIINKEQLEENQKSERIRTMNKDSIMSYEEQKEYVLDKIKKGYLPSEISKSDGTNTLTYNKVAYIKKILIKEGYISEEEASDAMGKHKKATIEKKHEHKRILDEKIRQRDEKYKKILEEKKQAEIEKITENYKKLKNDVIENYKNYMQGIAKLDTKKNKEYLKCLLLMNEYEIEVDTNEIMLAGEIIKCNPEVITKENIRYIIVNYYKNFGETATIKYINVIIGELQETEYPEKLENIKTNIKRISLKGKMQEMQKNGESINDIAKKLGVSFQEVIRVLNDKIKIDIER